MTDVFCRLRVNSVDPNVTYGISGEPLISDHAAGRLFRSTDTYSPADQPQQTSRWSFLPVGSLARSTKAFQIDSQCNSTAIITRRNDCRPTMLTDEAPVLSGSPQHIVYTSRAHMEAVVVDEMKVYHDRPLLFWLFIVDGVALIVFGILSLLWCLSWDIMHYSRFWSGILVIHK